MTKQFKSHQDEYTRAGEIATRDGLIVKPISIGEETVYVVVRPVNLSVHVVRREDGGLICDAACACTRFGRYCAHRAAVHTHLIAECEAERAHIAQAPTMPRPVVRHDRDTAMLDSRADNRGFSIWKS